MGRPSKFTAKLAEEIVERLSLGEPMAAICRDIGDITPRTVRNWMEADEQFSAAIARAREDGFDAIADECLSIADDSSGDTKVVGEDKREVCDTEFVQRSKLRIETRLKLLAKWDPKRYGERLDLNHSGSVNTQTDEQLDARIALLSAKLGSADDADREG
jgi:hypothetical protein